MTKILQMQGIKKSFGGVHALKGVDFDISAGEVVALVGENGAGKSTLMKILGGVHQPDEGTILINGAPARINSVSDAIKHGVSFIHQELNVLENLDVAANVFLGREPVRFGFLKLINRKRIHAETKRHLNHLGLNVPTDTPLSRLSIAQQQMVEIASVVA
jgi:ribose transport system ATP-binding protein